MCIPSSYLLFVSVVRIDGWVKRGASCRGGSLWLLGAKFEANGFDARDEEEIGASQLGLPRSVKGVGVGMKVCWAIRRRN